MKRTVYPSTSRIIRPFLRYIARHSRRAWSKTILSLLLAALLVGAVGQLAQLRSRYADLLSSVEVDVRFYYGLSYSKAKALEKSGYVRDPVYLKSYEAASGFYMITLVFTNRMDSLYTEDVTWLEGWDEESAMSANGLYCILPAPFMEEERLELGDEFRINERDVMTHLLEPGQPAPKDQTESLVLRDAKRPKYKIIGRIETEDSQWLAVAPASSFQYFASYLASELYFDSATYKLCSYYDADEFRNYAKELLLTAKNPPELRMDTSAADRLYRNYRLIETLYPISVIAALILGTLLPVLMVLQSKQEAAILRALGWPKTTVLLRYALEQGVLCFFGIVIALLVLLIINGVFSTLSHSAFLLYIFAHFFACVIGVSAVTSMILTKSPMALLQAKE